MMINNHEQHTQNLGQQPARLLRHEVERRLATEVERLLNRNDDEGLSWAGSRRDLVEALHVAFSTGLIEDGEGCQLTFKNMVGRACNVLHIAPPNDPYELAARAHRRKGRQRSTFMRRYELMLSRQVETPFLQHIIH